MHRGQFVWLGCGLCVSFALIGCVAMGRPLDSIRGRSGPEVPLVPVPPPPLGKIEGPGTITPVSAAGPAAEIMPPTPVKPAVSPAATPTSLPPPKPLPAPAAKVTARQLYQDAQDRYATIDSYIVRLRRREQVRDKLNPEEVLKFKFRKTPWSVHFKWLGKEGQGREVVYVSGRHQGKIHTLLAAGDIFLVPAGRRMAFLPDNILVRSASRHPITEAGIGASIDVIGTTLEGIEHGDRSLGTLTVLTGVARDEFKQPVNGIEHRLPPGLDPSLPKGGRRTWFFDPETKLPMLICTVDESEKLVEYYRYDRLQYPVKLVDSDFDPDRLWGMSTPRTAGR